MMKRVALLASLLVGFGATAAQAAVTWNVVTTTSDMSPITAVTPGATVTMTITAVSDGEQTFAIGSSAFGYDSSVLTFLSGTTSSAVLVQVATGPGTGFGGLDSTQIPTQVMGGTNSEVQFFNGVTISGTPATGAADISPITMVAGGPQFQLVFTAGATGSTTATIGSSQAYGDAVVGTGGIFLTSNNAPITVTIPEPGAVASSLAALGSVFAVAGIRRRR